MVWILPLLNKTRKTHQDLGLGLEESITVDKKEIKITRISREEQDKFELFIYRQLQRQRYSKVFESLKLSLEIQLKEKMASLFPIWVKRDKLIRVKDRVALALRDQNIEHQSSYLLFIWLNLY